MKIAFHLNCLEHGGAERVVVNLADRFVEEGHSVYIATEWQGENEYIPDPRVQRVHAGLKDADESKNRVSKFLLRVRYLKQFLTEYKPDVLIAFDHRAGYRALMACKNTGVPVVLSVRTNPEGHYDRLSDRLQIRWLFPRAAGCVFQTEDQRKFFYPYLQENSCVILNPVNPKFFEHAATAAATDSNREKEKSVVHHARLTDFKNQQLLIRAFLCVHETHPDYVLRIYGEDSGDGTKEALEKLIKDKNAEDCVFLMGGGYAFEEVLPKGSAYVFSSDWEGLPNSLLEAMALGMPVVSTDCPCGGPRTVIDHEKNGLLVPVKDEEAMAHAITRLIEDRELAGRLGAEAVRIKERTSPDVIYKQWHDYLSRMLQLRS